MNRSLLWLGTVFLAAVTLTTKFASAGDGPAHTAAIVAAAHAVKTASFPHGVGAPTVGKEPVDGKFKIPVPDGYGNTDADPFYDNSKCWLCRIPGSRSCFERCALGLAVNAPDFWSCTDSAQPPLLTTINTQLTLKATNGGIAEACNYTHFVFNPAVDVDAHEATVVTNEWASQIIKSIRQAGGQEEFSCNTETFNTYVARVANMLHYVQDSESEHHKFGNEVCGLNGETVPQLVPPGTLADSADGCEGWLKETLDSGTLAKNCDTEIVDDEESADEETDVLSWNVATMRALCSGGAPLACMGLERILRHHCELDVSKSIHCQGDPNDHYSQTHHAAYCEGERFSGGGENFVALATAASQQPFEDAMQAWAGVCREPDDPCNEEQCTDWCHRQYPQKIGYCVSDTAGPDCKRHRCECGDACGVEKKPCCPSGDPCTAQGTVCNGATGLCEKGTEPPNNCSLDGSGPMAGVGGASGMGTGEGGEGGEGGDNGDAGAQGADPNGGSGGSGHHRPNPRYQADGWGDPHLNTFDGLKYDIQAVGELTFVRDPTDDLEIQVRTHPWGSSTRAATVSGVAARVGNDRVALYLDHPSTVNGAPASFSPNGTDLPGGGTVYQVNAGALIVWPDGTALYANHPLGYFSLFVYLPPARSGKVVGLLGAFDGSTKDELHTREGAVLPSPADFETFYGVYTESWRITQQDSLFDYGPGETTETYTDRSFPHQLLRTQDLDPGALSYATQVCTTAGISDPHLLDACKLDVGETNDATFAQGYASLLAPKEALEILPPHITGGNNGGGLGHTPVRAGTLAPGGKDFFSFSAAVGEAIQIRAVDVAGGPFVPLLQVYDPAGTLISSDYRGDVAYASFNAASSGTFTVVVSDRMGQTSAAEYKLYFVKAPGSNEGGALVSGSNVSDTIDKGDLDSYTFTASVGEAVQLRLVDTTGGPLTPALTVYDPTGKAISSDYRGDVAYASFNAALSGSYTVVAYDWTNGSLASTGAYQLHFVKVPGRAEYPELVSGSDVVETIQKGDLDSYTFTANVGEAVQLRLVDLAGGALTPALAIYDPTGKVVSSDYRGDVAYASFNAAVSGTYAALVYDWSNGSLASTGDYKLSFVKAPGKAEYAELISGIDVSETIEKGDLDSYTFTANVGEAVQLRLVDVAGGPLTPALAIYDPTGKVVSSDYRGDVAYASFNAATSGTYSVLVYDWSNGSLASTGAYRLSFAKAPGASEYGALPSGGRVSGSIEKGDLDSYTFTAAVGESVQLRLADLGASAFTPALTVYDPTGKMVSSDYRGGVAYASFTAATSGTYFVFVYDWTNGSLASTGDYDLYFAKAPGANEGGTLSTGVAVSGTIDKGDIDSFTFAATAGTAHSLTISGPGFTPALYVYGPTGAGVSSTYSPNGVMLSFNAATTGTYTVLAYDWTNGSLAGTGNYSLLFQ